MSTRGSAARSPIGGWGRWVTFTAIAVAVWGAPTAASVWSTTGWSAGSKLRHLVAAYTHLLDPQAIEGSGLHGRAFGYTTISLLAAATLGGLAIAVRLVNRRAGIARGLAHGQDLVRFSAKAMVARATVILGAANEDPTRSGFMIGREKYSHREIWLPKESTILVLAPPRSGKTSGIVAPAVVDHHGPVVATGVRDDIMMWTHPWRAQRGGPMWLCEPMRVGGDLPAGVREVRWSPLSGCQEMVTARLRAEALFAALPKAGGDDEFWRTAGQALLAGYLMAAARKDGHINDVLEWIDRDTDTSPVETLRWAANLLTDPADELERASLSSVAAQLEAAIGQDPRYRAGVTGQALQAVEPFRLPAIRRMCNIPIGESFDPTVFLTESGTIWMLGSESHQRQAAGVCTALTAAIVEAARALARTMGGRLRPPLLLALDEAVNVAPIPRLEQLLSTGGGSGLQTMIVLQSMAAARNAWGKEMGDALLDYNNAKLVLGGLSDAQDLQDVSTLLGQRDETVTQASRRGTLGMLDPGDYTYSWRQVPVLYPSEIRELDSEVKREALLIARSAKGIMLVQDRIFDRTPPTAVTRRRRHGGTGR